MKGRNGLKGQQEWSQDWGEGDSVPGTLGPVCDLVSRERCPSSHLYSSRSWRLLHLLGNGWAGKLFYPANIY